MCMRRYFGILQGYFGNDVNISVVQVQFSASCLTVIARKICTDGRIAVFSAQHV